MIAQQNRNDRGRDMQRYIESGRTCHSDHQLVDQINQPSIHPSIYQTAPKQAIQGSNPLNECGYVFERDESQWQLRENYHQDFTLCCVSPVSVLFVCFYGLPLILWFPPIAGSITYLGTPKPSIQPKCSKQTAEPLL